MPIVQHFSIHGVVTLTVRSHVGSRVLASVGRQLAPFRVPALAGAPQIVVDLMRGGHGPARSGLTGREAPHTSAEGVSWSNRFKLGAWHVTATGLGTGPTRVQVSGSRWVYRYLLFHVLEPLIDFHLALQGMALVHASAVGTTDAAVAFSSPSGVGKTSLAVLLLTMGLPQFLGDEFVILSKDGTVLSFPLPMSLFHRNLVATPSLRHRLAPIAKAALAMNRLLAALSGTYVRPRLPVSVDELFPAVTVPGTLRLNALCHLVSIGGGAMSVREAEPADVADRVLASSRFEFRHFRRALDAFATAFPESAAAGHDARTRAVVHQVLQHTPCYEIGIPRGRGLEGAHAATAVHRVLSCAMSPAG